VDDGGQKAGVLRRRGVLNPHPERITDEEFLSSEFFDVRDLIQVKYEMVRRVQRQSLPVSSVAKAFGFSRTAYYEAQSALEQGGLPGLLPQRPGPRRAHKLSDEVVDFLQEAGSLPAPQLSVDAFDVNGVAFTTAIAVTVSRPAIAPG